MTDDEIRSMSDEEFREASKEELKKMGLSRAERRKREREFDKNYKAMKAFTPSQLKLMEEVVQYGVKERLEKKVETISYIADMATSAYFYMEDENITDDEVYKKQEILTTEFTESYEKYKKIIKGCKGDLNMAKKKFEKFEEDVKKASEELLDKGIKSQSKAVKELQMMFPELSNSMLVNAFRKVKEARKAEAEQEKEAPKTDDDKAAEYVFDDETPTGTLEDILNEKAVTIDVSDNKSNTAIEPQKELGQANTPREELRAAESESEPLKGISEPEQHSTLKIISRNIVVEGQFGTYTKDAEGVTINDRTYKSMADVDEEASSLIDTQESNIRKIEADMKALRDKLDESNDIIVKIQSMANEIKAVINIQ